LRQVVALAPWLSIAFRNGIYARRPDWVYPAAYLDFNQRLFARVKLPFNSSSWGRDGRVFRDFATERRDAKIIMVRPPSSLSHAPCAARQHGGARSIDVRGTG
jgi:hypothetical protein